MTVALVSSGFALKEVKLSTFRDNDTLLIERCDCGIQEHRILSAEKNPNGTVKVSIRDLYSLKISSFIDDKDALYFKVIEKSLRKLITEAQIKLRVEEI